MGLFDWIFGFSALTGSISRTLPVENSLRISERRSRAIGMRIPYYATA